MLYLSLEEPPESGILPNEVKKPNILRRWLAWLTRSSYKPRPLPGQSPSKKLPVDEEMERLKRLKLF